MSQTNAIASINSLLLQLPEALQIEALHYVEYLKQRIAINEVDQPDDRETDPIVLMQLPLADRRQVLAAQAAVMVAHYEQDNDWREFTAGEFIEYFCMVVSSDRLPITTDEPHRPLH